MNSPLLLSSLFLLFLLAGCAQPTDQPKKEVAKEIDPASPYSHIKDEKARDLIRASIEEAGGLERWNNLKQLSYTKEFSLLREDGSVEKSYDQLHEYQFNPARIKITSIENGDTLVTTQVGRQFSRTKNGEKMEANPTSLEKAINTSTYVIGIPFKLLDPGAQISYIGPTSLPDGRTAEVIEVQYDAETNENHSTSDVWRYYIDKNTAQIIANWVDAGDHYALILNNSFESANGILFHGNRESYRVDEAGKPLFLRARYEYGNYHASQVGDHKSAPLKIAFGSCGHEDHPLPIFDEVLKQTPDLFLFLGDNIYGDTKDMNVLAAKYQLLADKPSFQRLKRQVPIMATWDDHDFGWNDAGRHYPFKQEAKKLFLDFFDEPVNSERRKREGIYTSEIIENGDKKVQIILLDTRTFRDDLLTNQQKDHPDRRYFYHLEYVPHTSPDSTLLGEAQWNWLGKQLEIAADVRIIASSTQFGIEYNGYEAWANFPHEQKRMLELIKEKQAEGVLFVSGDVHYAEISKLEIPSLYPIYDVTSSGLSSTWHFATPNVNRIEGPVMDNHFGLLTIDFTESKSIKMEIWDIHSNQRIEYTIPLNQLRFK